MDNEYLAQLIADLADRLSTIEGENDGRDQKIEKLEAKIEELESEIDDLKSSISDLENP